jgi:protease IV
MITSNLNFKGTGHMEFARGAWRILVAIKDGLALLLLLLFFGLIFAALSAGPNPASVRDGALVIELAGTVSEQPAEVDPIAALMSSQAPMIEYRQRDIVRSLELAAKDDRIKAVVFDLDKFMGGGQASIAAIGKSIDAVKKAGKPVYSFATAYSDDSYQLAAHSTQIWLDPLGGVLLTGPGGSRNYYKGMLDKLGVIAHIYKVGTYKSAVEPFIRADQSPEAEQAIKAVYDEIWGAWRSDVAKARPAAQFETLLSAPAAATESVKGDLATLAVQNKLVDKLGDRMSFGKFLSEKVGKDAAETTGGYSSTSMGALLASTSAKDNGDAIGVVTIAGEIVDGEGGPGTAAGDTVSKLIYEALDNRELKALVVRVDSPGGSVTASEKIRLAIAAAKEKKLPVVVSMANLAASGGYWVSMPADTIFAEPATITGSIGIFGIIPSGEKALANIGITSDGVKTTPLSGEPDVFGGISPEFDRVMQSVIENGYSDFLSRVATSRKKTPEQIDAIGQGRVWAGGTAKQIGLVDRFGGIDDALAEAAKLAKLGKDDWHAEYIEPKISPLAAFLAGTVPAAKQASAPMDLFARASWEQQASWNRIAADLSGLNSVRGAQVRCLECGVIAGTPVMQAEVKASGGWFAALARLIAG